ncbi:beta-Ig-H3/fasciclin [Xylariales sp. AK1849]|nr:beta-Ig-H3/fasciclin [Xylariales sp. AK1849]
MRLQSPIPFLIATAAAESLTNVLAANSDMLSTLNSLLGTVPQLTSALATAANITIVAPSNQAFTKLMTTMPNATAMTQNTTFVTTLLEYHVLSGMFSSSTFSTTPVFASSVLTTSSTLGTSAQKVELIESNKEALVLSGFKQASRVSKADIMFDGGVLHVIDTVLTIPESPSVTALDTGLTSLAGALVKTNMLAGVDSLKDATIFAPSNAAFSAVGNVVTAADMELLSDVLDYHVVTGSVMHSTDLMRLTSNGGSTTLRTLQGGSVTVRQENGALYVNGAEIMLADVLTSNGVVHVIDSVMNPLATTALPDVAKATQKAEFAGASSQSSAPFTSGILPTTTIIPVTLQAGAYGALPTGALMGVVGAAAVMANL